MVSIRINPETKEIEIKMPVFYLYEIIDNDEWLAAVLNQAKELMIQELEKAGLNDNQESSNQDQKSSDID